MFVTLRTLVYAADRSNISEMVTIRNQIIALYGREFAAAAETNPNSINETVRDNINLILPQPGRKVARIIQIAKDEGINYRPTDASMNVR